MPEICRFYGIVIRMHENDHPPPHFHAQYGSEEAAVDLRSLRIFRGELRPRPRRLVLEWARIHRAELLANWDLLERGLEMRPISPLE